MEIQRSARTYRDGDEEGIFELLKTVYPSVQHDRARWMRWWHWMFKEDPVGPSCIYIIDEQDKIIAHHAYYMFDLKVRDEIVKGCQGRDLMRHPDPKYKGLGKYIFDIGLQQQASKKEVRIIIGFVNETVHLTTISAGYLDVALIRPMIKILNLRRVLETRIKNRGLSKLCAISSGLLLNTMYGSRRPPHIEGLTITQVASFDDRVNGLWSRVSDSHQIMAVRNKPYLNWRYGAPGIDNTIYVAEQGEDIVGYIVLRCEQQNGMKQARIYDIVGQSEQVIHRLVAEAVERSRNEEADYVYCTMLASRAYLRAMRRNGFLSAPFTNSIWFCAYSNAPPVSSAFIQNPQNWFIQLGDTDVY
ncbi:MAG TPA: GNAT family N-acetyltransferase [Dehalococcoidia bacterium]|nr:GNAT family N-acetyltransferase [Dehalococcoidia bacterium]